MTIKAQTNYEARLRPLDEYVREFGPACPDPFCTHRHCAAVRGLRDAADDALARDEANAKTPRCDDATHWFALDAGDDTVCDCGRVRRTVRDDGKNVIGQAPASKMTVTINGVPLGEWRRYPLYSVEITPQMSGYSGTLHVTRQPDAGPVKIGVIGAGHYPSHAMLLEEAREAARRHREGPTVVELDLEDGES